MRQSYPIIKDFRNCTRDDFAEAAKELLVLVIFAGLPIWLGFVISGLSKGDKTVARFLLEFLASGEGLLISAALVGPLFYVITRRYGELPESLTIRFPQGWLFVVLITLICMTAAALFGFDRVFKDHSANSASSVFEESSMRVFSSMVLTFAILIVYLVSVLRNYLDRGAASIMRNDTQKFLEEWGKK